MKVILLENIRKIGQKGELLEVSAGYGRNYLIKNNLAELAISGKLKEIENKFKQNQKISENLEQENEIIFEKINNSKIEIKSKANNSGHLFAAVHKKNIAEKVNLKEKNIILKKDLKEIGEFEINFKIGEKKGKFLLIISDQ